MKQKIIKVGNSLAVTLPASFVREIKLKSGEYVALECSSSQKTILIKPSEMEHTISLTPEFFEWLNHFSKKYEKLLKELANTDTSSWRR